MKRVKLIVAYDGTNYCGWQVQPNGITIEQVLNENLSKLDVQRPFAEFITDVTLIDSNIRRGLRRLELKLNNKYLI